jgi:hypothetical protein
MKIYKPTRIKKQVHNIHIIGDSHLKGIASKINQYLGSQFAVSSFIKPGAMVKQIVETQDRELKALGSKDLIVINGGSNDLANNHKGGKSALSGLLKFVQYYANTNVLMLNVPVRYDPLTNHRTNYIIRNANDKLHRVIKLLKHAHLFEMLTDRKYFTTHGFHLNNFGKERVAKAIAGQIREIVDSRPIKQHIYSLPWYDAHTAMITTVDNASSSNLEHHTQQILSKSSDRAGLSDEVDLVSDDSGSGIDEDEKAKLKSVSVLDARSVKVKETDAESVNAEVEEHKDISKGPCAVTSVTKKVDDGKSVRVSKSKFGVNSGINSMCNKSVSDKDDDDLSCTMRKVPHESSTTKTINHTSVEVPSVLDTSAWESRRSSSRNKIPTPRSSDFLWHH